MRALPRVVVIRTELERSPRLQLRSHLRLHRPNGVSSRRGDANAIMRQHSRDAKTPAPDDGRFRSGQCKRTVNYPLSSGGGAVVATFVEVASRAATPRDEGKRDKRGPARVRGRVGVEPFAMEWTGVSQAPSRHPGLPMRPIFRTRVGTLLCAASSGLEGAR